VADRFFLDTNILVYSFDRSDPDKQQRSLDLVENALESRNGVISYQVIQEFLNVALRRFRKTLPPAEARIFLNRVLIPICEVYPDDRLYAEALSIVEETGWGFYDSLIVSSAAAAGCARLWTEDLEDGSVIRGVEIRNPFGPRPSR
jgi:predicted nucleic acid-binding protein